MLGVIITLAAVAAIAYFVIKNYYPPIILLIIGLILLLIAGLTGTPPVGAKTSTHFHGSDEKPPAGAGPQHYGDCRFFVLHEQNRGFKSAGKALHQAACGNPLALPALSRHLHRGAAHGAVY